ATPFRHEAQGVLERENAGCHKRGEFTERVAGHEPGSEIHGEGRDAARLDTVARAASELCVDRLDERLEYRDARREDRGLRDHRARSSPRLCAKCRAAATPTCA